MVYVPEFGNLKLEQDAGPDGYIVKATISLTGRMHAYQLEHVIKALEAHGYEVRKKDAGKREAK